MRFSMHKTRSMEKKYFTNTFRILTAGLMGIALLAMTTGHANYLESDDNAPDLPLWEESPGETRINAGGEFTAATDSGADWQANNVSGPVAGANYTVNTGIPFTTAGILFENRDASIPSYIDEATFNALFGTERYDEPAAPEMEFNIPVGNGEYLVNIYLANGFVATSMEGTRVFDIMLEGVLVKDNLDLITEFGHQVAGMLQFPVTVTDNSIDIQFMHEVENPLVNAIEIVTMGTVGDVPINVDPIADQTNTEGDNLGGGIMVIASGGDGDLSFSATGLPTGLFIDDVTGVIFGMIEPGAAAGSPYTTTITVDDSDAETSDAVSITFNWVVNEPEPSTSLRINAGGGLIAASDSGGDWQANDISGAFTGNGYTVNTGNVFNGTGVVYANRDASIPAYVDEATFNAIFGSERFDFPAAPEMEFSVPLVNGNYTVNIYAANSFEATSAVGQRIFDIEIEGTVVEADLDLVARFGHLVGGMLSYDITLSDGQMNITFLHGLVENPLVNAIEIIGEESNEIPIEIVSFPNQFNFEGDVLGGDLGIQASGGDGDLSYMATNLPAGISLDESTGVFSGTIQPGAAAASPYTVEVTVDDNDGNPIDTASLSFTWTVEADDMAEGFGGFYLIDADTDTPITKLEEGMEIDYESVKGKRLTIEVVYKGEGKRMFLKLQGPTSKRKLERYAPYTLYGDDGNGNYYGKRFKKGPYRMRAWVFPKRWYGWGDDDKHWERYEVRFRLGQRKHYDDDDDDDDDEEDSTDEGDDDDDDESESENSDDEEDNEESDDDDEDDDEDDDNEDEEGDNEDEDEDEEEGNEEEDEDDDDSEDDDLDGTVDSGNDEVDSGSDRFTESVVVVHRNPVASELEFQVNKPEMDVIHVAIYDTKGRLVRTIVRKDLGRNGSQYNLDINGLRDGLYFMNITSSNYETITKRVLIRNIR